MNSMGRSASSVPRGTNYKRRGPLVTGTAPSPSTEAEVGWSQRHRWGIIDGSGSDGGGSNGIVPAAVHDNNDMMALAAMASLTDGGDGNNGLCH